MHSDRRVTDKNHTEQNLQDKKTRTKPPQTRPPRTKTNLPVKYIYSPMYACTTKNWGVWDVWRTFGGSRDVWKCVTRGRGTKLVQNSMTYFMDGPSTLHFQLLLLLSGIHFPRRVDCYQTVTRKRLYSTSCLKLIFFHRGWTGSASE